MNEVLPYINLAVLVGGLVWSIRLYVVQKNDTNAREEVMEMKRGIEELKKAQQEVSVKVANMEGTVKFASELISRELNK